MNERVPLQLKFQVHDDPIAMASVVVRHRPPFRGMSAFTVAVRRRSNCEGAMPQQLAGIRG